MSGLFARVKRLFSPQPQRQGQPASTPHTTLPHSAGVTKRRRKRSPGVNSSVLINAIQSPAKGILSLAEWLLPRPNQLGDDGAVPRGNESEQDNTSGSDTRDRGWSVPEKNSRLAQASETDASRLLGIRMDEDSLNQGLTVATSHIHDPMALSDTESRSRSRNSELDSARRSRSHEPVKGIFVDLTIESSASTVAPEHTSEDWVKQRQSRAAELEAERRRKSLARWLGDGADTRGTRKASAPDAVAVAPAVATREQKQHEGTRHGLQERGEGGRAAEDLSSRIEEVSLDSLAADKARLCLYEQRFKASVGLEELSQNYRSLEQKNRERLARELEASRSKADALHKELKQDIEADLRKLHIKPRLPVIPDEGVVDSAWGPGSMSERLTSKWGIDITRADIMRLDGLNWLNDEIINFFMKMVTERSDNNAALPRVFCHNTYFFKKLTEESYDKVKRWTRKIDIFALDFLIVPVHVGGSHWCLGVINFKEKRLEYYDSLGGRNMYAIDYMRRYLELESMDKKKIEYDTSPWTQYLPGSKVPQQDNGSDCGVFLCQFADYTSRAAEFDFTCKDMPYFRRAITYQVLTNHLLT